MQSFTQDESLPRKSTILFIKQFARIYSNVKSAGAMASVMCLN